MPVTKPDLREGGVGYQRGTYGWRLLEDAGGKKIWDRLSTFDKVDPGWRINFALKQCQEERANVVLPSTWNSQTQVPVVDLSLPVDARRGRATPEKLWDKRQLQDRHRQPCPALPATISNTRLLIFPGKARVAIRALASVALLGVCLDGIWGIADGQRCFCTCAAPSVTMQLSKSHLTCVTGKETQDCGKKARTLIK